MGADQSLPASSYVTMGRRFQTRTCTSVDEANAFMAANPPYACLAQLEDGTIHLALKTDDGTPEPRPARPGTLPG